MLTTDFAPGSPCWLDLGAPDTRRAAAFYGAVLGWTFEAVNPESPEFGFLQSAGRTVAALGPLTEEGARSAWMLYFATTDADATTTAVTDAGGTVRVAPTGMDDTHRMAQYTDPQGGQFAVFEPRDDMGLDLVDAPAPSPGPSCTPRTARRPRPSTPRSSAGPTRTCPSRATAAPTP